jgi:hypothetical protein
MAMSKNQGAGMRMDPETLSTYQGGMSVNPAQMPPWLARANTGVRANLGMEPGNPGSQIPGPPQPGTPMAAQRPPTGNPAVGTQNPQLPLRIAQLMAKSGGRVRRGA